MASDLQLIKSQDELLEVLADYGFDADRVTILLKSNRFAEAADLRLKEGDIIEAIRLFLQDNQPTSHQRAASCILNILWKSFPLGASNGHLSDALVVLQLSESVDYAHLCPQLQAELEQSVSVLAFFLVLTNINLIGAAGRLSCHCLERHAATK